MHTKPLHGGYGGRSVDAFTDQIELYMHLGNHRFRNLSPVLMAASGKGEGPPVPLVVGAAILAMAAVAVGTLLCLRGVGRGNEKHATAPASPPTQRQPDPLLNEIAVVRQFADQGIDLL